jgi:ABC-2 type transport system ATP-binding protein
VKSIVVLIAVGSLAAAGCSSSGAKSASPKPTTSTTTAGPGGAYTRPACTRKVAAKVVSTPVAGSTIHYDIVSFDGAKIRAHWFPVTGTKDAPTVLKGPGWGQPGDVNTAGSGYGLFGDMSIHSLNAAGYNVLTWDPRGFGASGGTVESDSPDFEGRDTQRLIDWVAQQPGVQLDGPGDPRMGMVGASYGGGIQLVTAGLDCRVDAIVPQIAWHSLGTSLNKNDTSKRGWGDFLYTAASGKQLDPHIDSAHAASDSTGVISPADKQWFIDRGPGADLVSKISAPTLIEQGTIDTLFTLDEGETNYQILHDNGVPTAMIWMCSGHGVCLTKPGNQALPGTAALAWLNRYVKGDTSVKLGARFQYVDQNGAQFTADEFPPPASTPITATGSGDLSLTAEGGAGPATSTGNSGPLGTISLPITPGKASNAVNVPISVANAANIVGAPKLTIDYSGTTPAGAAPTRVFAQLVDDATGLVLGNQITPIPVILDGAAHTATFPLEIVAFTAKPGAKLTLQIVPTTVAYTQPRLGGKITFDTVKIELPTVTGVTDAAAVSQT